MAVALVGGLCSTAARADWTGDGHADVLAADRGERLVLYRGNGAGGWISGAGVPIGSGWGSLSHVTLAAQWRPPKAPPAPPAPHRPARAVCRATARESAGGSAGRVYARVHYRRAGSDRVRRKTVSRRFVTCR